MTKKKPTTRPAARPTTALAKRPKPKPKATTALMPARRRPAPAAAPAPAPPPPLPDRILTDDVVLGDFGLSEITFTADEEAILNRPFDITDMRVKPDGAVYISHPSYTRRLNAAFGRGRWHMVPSSRPQVGQGTVVVPYRLFVHGIAIAFAYGEQEYHENNPNQSYGDAIEATQASGLRRLCKRLGIALELWDKDVTDAFLAEHAVRVPCEVKQRDNTTKVKYQWRLKRSPPFWNEVESRNRAAKPAEQRAPARPVTTALHNPDDNEPLTEQQIRQFWTIARRRGRDEGEIRRYLKERYNADSTKQIKRKDWDTVKQWLEHPPARGDAPRERVIDIRADMREPGEDD